MYRSILQTILNLGISPVPFWKGLGEGGDFKETFLSKFLYPLLGFTAVATFIGLLFRFKEYNIEYALKTATVTFVSLFAGFFLAAFLLNEVAKKFFAQPDNLPRTQQFVGYVSSLGYAIISLQALFYDLFFLKFFLLYAIYLIWVGSEHFLQIPEKKRYQFMIVATLILYLSPTFIQYLMFKLMPGLSVR